MQRGEEFFSLGKVYGLSVRNRFCKGNKEQLSELYSGLHIDTFIFASRQTTSFVCTSQIFLCIIVCLEVMYLMLLHNLTPAAHLGNCSEAELSLDTLERFMGQLVVGV